MNQDQEHLRLLSIFHYIVGGIVVLFSLMPVIHLALGILFLVAPHRMGESPPPSFLGWIFIILGGSFMIVGWIFAVCVILAGRYLVRHKPLHLLSGHCQLELSLYAFWNYSGGVYHHRPHAAVCKNSILSC